MGIPSGATDEPLSWRCRRLHDGLNPEVRASTGEEDADVLLPLSEGKRNRWWEAGGCST